MAHRVTYGKHAGAVLTLGLPLIGSHLAQMALHVTDTILLGWYSIEALAAGVLGATTFFVLFILGSGFAQGVMPLVAQAGAAGDDVQVRRATRMGLWLSIGYGVLILPVLWFSGPALRGLGQDPQVAGLAQDFLRIAGFGMVPALTVMVLKSYLAALQRTQVVLWVTIAGCVLNGALAWALIFGHWGAPELGVRGAAISSLVTQVVTAALMLAYAAGFGPLRRYALFHRFWRSDPRALYQVWRLGWPIGLAGLAESGLFSASSVMMGWIGTRELAAHGIAMEIAAITFMVHLGLSNAATVRAGRAIGEGDRVGLRDGALVAIALSGLFGLIAVALFLSLPGPMIGLFLASDEPDRARLIAIGSGLLAMAALFQLADAAQVMALGLLRRVQDTRVPMLIAIVGYWVVGAPSSYAIGIWLGYGGQGVWFGLVIGLAMVAILLMTRFWGGAARQVGPVVPDTTIARAGF